MCGFCFFLSAAIEDLQALYKLAVGFDGVVSVNVYAKPRKPVSWYKMTSDGSKSLLIKQNDKDMHTLRVRFRMVMACPT